jgi:xanthine dehydrogenase molybdopterin-binding subunit B
VETLTGEVRPRRIDLCFCSVSEAAGSEYRAAMAAGLDRGLDWILNEGLRFDGKGRLLSPDRQFCRSGADEPEIRFHFAADGRADRPDFDAGMLAAQASQLAASAYFAIRNALRACAAAERATGPPSTFRLDLPATAPAIRRALAETGA